MWDLSHVNQGCSALKCSPRPPSLAHICRHVAAGAQSGMEAPVVLFDDVGNRLLRWFSRPLSLIRAHASDEIGPAFAAIEAALSARQHVAGYLSYELGYRLEPRLAPLLPQPRGVPLLWFGVFDAPQEISAPESLFRERVRGRAYAGPLQHEWNEAEYAARFLRVHRYIEGGDIYQANLSFRSRFHFVGDPLALYVSLREQSRAAHAAYLDDGERQILSLSPELFFAISADGHITARPMKGTAPRGITPAADAAARAHLRASDKERAENLMIVDLLRNDLGRIAEIGSVAVDELFAIETYPTLHQMVSTVSANVKPRHSVADVVRALFPCGSVTGAPKIRAMEIISELESSPRGIYCGAVGHFAPDGSASFNVAIRTLTIAGARGELGIGGAVVYDSRAAAEYAECLLKARYFEAARQPLELIETLRWSPTEGFLRLDRHLARMEASAAVFGISFSRSAALSTLQQLVFNANTAQRVRLTLAEDGTFACTNAPVFKTTKPWRFTISPQRVAHGDLFLSHKTNRRELFEAEQARAAVDGFDEAIFLNQRGEITEGSRTNMFVRLGGTLVTPPLGCGLLNGCLRQELLETGECSEAVLFPDDLERADAVYLGNSLRGLIPAVP
jgi:para-aminobenzoate synthetase/4-amino-4-deoxychorismate lyase